ncbi:MAG: sortase, partial [Pseudomonadota bacterium]
MKRGRLTMAMAGAAGLIGAVFIAQGAYMPAKATLAQHMLEKAWAEAVIGGDAVRPWSWADAHVMGELRAPDHDARAIILSEASGEALAFAPGHLSHTPAPGERGVSVIAAHRDTHFKFLRNIALGDTIEITDLTGVRRRFIVEETRIVDARAP